VAVEDAVAVPVATATGAAAPVVVAVEDAVAVPVATATGAAAPVVVAVEDAVAVAVAEAVAVEAEVDADTPHVEVKAAELVLCVPNCVLDKVM